MLALSLSPYLVYYLLYVVRLDIAKEDISLGEYNTDIKKTDSGSESLKRNPTCSVAYSVHGFSIFNYFTVLSLDVA